MVDQTADETTSETESRIYRGKKMTEPNPAPARVYYPKRFYGEQTGVATGVATEAAARNTAAPSFSAEEIRANSTTVAGASGTPSGTTASGGAATTPTSAR